MPDIRLAGQRTVDVTSLEAVTLDWLLASNGSLDTSHELATSIMVALGSDRIADPADQLPDPDSTDRRGWWGDLDAEDIWGGWPIGSRLWLLSRAAITSSESDLGSTTARIEAYVREAMQPFVDAGVASSFAVRAERTGLHRIACVVTIRRGAEPSVELRFQHLWTGIQES